MAIQIIPPNEDMMTSEDETAEVQQQPEDSAVQSAEGNLKEGAFQENENIQDVVAQWGEIAEGYVSDQTLCVGQQDFFNEFD